MRAKTQLLKLLTLMLLLLTLLLIAPTTMAFTRINLRADLGANTFITSVSGTNAKALRVCPGAELTLYLAGTTTKPSTYATSTGTSKANPTTANSLGEEYFFVADGTYDYRVVGCGMDRTIRGLVVAGGAVGYSVTGYGAVCDGVTDDAVALTAAFADFESAVIAGGRPKLITPSGKGCASSVPLDIIPTASQTFDIDMQGPLIDISGSQSATFLLIGPTGTAKNIQRGIFNIWVERSTQSDWSDAGNTGVHLRNFSHSSINIRSVRHFTRGVLLEGSGFGGFAENEIYIGRLGNNRYGLDFLAAPGAGSNGFINANVVRGPRILYNATGGASDTIHRYGIRFLNDNPSFIFPPTGNIVYGGVIQLGVNNSAYGHPFYFESGDRNWIHDVYVETAAEIAEFASNGGSTTDPHDNFIDVSVDETVTTKILDHSALGTNIVTTSRRGYAERASKLVYDAPDVLSLATPYSGTAIHFHGIGVLNSSGGYTNRDTNGANNVAFGADHISVGVLTVLGAKVTTGSTKQFYITTNLAGGDARIYVQAFDSDGAIITRTGAGTWLANTAYSLKNRVQPTTTNGFWYRVTSAGTTHATVEPTWPTAIGGTVVDGTVTWTCEGAAPVTGNVDGSWSYNTGFGGVWRSLDKKEGFITVNPSVSSVFIGISGGTTNAQLRALRIYSVSPPYQGQMSTATLGYSGSNWTTRLADQSPQTSAFGGPFAVGTVVWNATPASAEAAFWACSVAGSPGTWLPGPAIP